MGQNRVEDLHALVESIAPLIKERKDFQKTFSPGPGFFSHGQEAESLLKKVIGEEFSVIADGGFFREFRGGLQLFSSSRVGEFVFFEKRDLFDAVEKRDVTKVEELLKSGFVDRAYFFSYDFSREPYQIKGRAVEGCCFGKVLFSRFVPISRAFLNYQEKPFRWLTLQALDMMLMLLVTQAEKEGLEGVVENPFFRSMFFKMEKKDLEDALEWARGSSTLRITPLALVFAHEVLGEETFRQKYGKDLPPSSKEDEEQFREIARELARIYKRDPSASSWVMKFLKDSAKPAKLKASRAL